MAISKHTRSRQLLAHILEQPGLVHAIQALEPEVLSSLVRHVGLEDAGELVALATPQQLLEVFDLDLWRSESVGQDASFDAARFALWLEVLLESGAKLAAQKVAELDEDFLTLALCQQVLVLDIEALARRMSAAGRSDEVDLVEKELESALYQEFEQFRVIAKDPRSWEPIRTLLVELDADHQDLFVRVLERCCYISGEYIEDSGGLYEVLSQAETLQADVAAEREERRTKKGFVAPSAATSFLAHARVTPLDELLRSDAIDPITRAYFRDSAAPEVGRAAARSSAVTPSDAVAPKADLLQTLREAEVIPASPALPLLGAGTSKESESWVVAAVRLLRERSEASYAIRLNELAYLANVLLAGCSYRARELRPVEAAQAVLATCNLGGERLLGSADADLAERLATLLETTSLVKLFRIGFHLLHVEVVLKASHAACTLLEREDGQTDAVSPAGRALSALRRELSAGRPWRAVPNLGQLVRGVSDEDEQTLRCLMQELPLSWSRQAQASGLPGFIERGAQLAAIHGYLTGLVAPRQQPPSARSAGKTRGKSPVE